MQSIKRSIYGLFKHRSSQQNETFKLSILESQQLGHSVVQSVAEYSVISASEWDNIILKKSFAIVDHSTLYFSVLKGLPNNLRFKIWLLMTDQSKCITTAQYVKLLDKSVAPESLQQIAKDIPRSFSDNQKYSGMRHQMQRILKISSLRPHGYIQGMNFILLYVMIICAHSQKGDEWCGPIHEMEYQKNIYCIFTHILDNLSQVFSPNAEGIYKLIAQLDQKISQNVPQIGYHFAKCGFESVSLFSANYYSLMMAAKPPLELAKSILDLFMLEGRKAIHALIVRMLQLYSQKILSIQQPMQLQKLIKTQMFQNCAQLLIQDKIKAHSIKDFGIAFYQQIQLTN